MTSLKPHILTLNKHNWLYLKSFKNKELPTLIGMNGFGLSAELLLNSTAVNGLNQNYNLLFIELPYLNENFSKHPIKHPFTANELSELIFKILEKEEITDFDFISYSHGSKLLINALATNQNISPRQFFLLAPDGFKDRALVNILCHLWIIQLLFYSFIYIHFYVNWTVSLLKLFGVLGKNSKKFVLDQINNQKQRRIIYQTYVGGRKLRHQFSDIQQKIDCYIIRGHRDNIIRLKELQKGIRKAKNQVEILEIKAGHNIYRKNAFTEICDIIKQKNPRSKDLG